MKDKFSGESNPIADTDTLQKVARQLLEQISKRNQKIAEYQRLGNVQDEKIFSLQKQLDDLNTQVAALTIHADGLSTLVAQKELEIQEIFNSNSWKVAMKLQKIRQLLFWK